MDSTSTTTTINNCDVTSNLNAVKATKDNCKSAFGLCRKAEDAAVGHVGNCKPAPIKCGGVTSVVQAKEELTVLEPLQTSLKKTEAQTAASFAAAGLRVTTIADTNDGKTPTGLAEFIAAQKAGINATADTSGCNKLAGEWYKFNTSADSTTI